MSNIDIAQKQLDAYNARTWIPMSFFAGLHGVGSERHATETSRDAIGALCQGLRQFPQNKAD